MSDAVRATAPGWSPLGPIPLSFSDERVVIVGAGLSGLATALSIVELAAARLRPVPRLTILEAAPRAGGAIRTTTAEGFLCEHGPGGFLAREPRTLELCRHLALDVLPAHRAAATRYLFADGRLHAVPRDPLALLTSPLLSLPARLRLAAEPLVPRRPAVAQDESLAGFARRRLGDEAFRLLVDALQGAIYAGDAEQLSAAACFPRLALLERSPGSLVLGLLRLLRQRRRGDPLPGAVPPGTPMSFIGGLQSLTDRLAAVLPGELRCSAPVHAVLPAGPGAWAVATPERSHRADAVVLACPAPAAAGMLGELDPPLAAALREIRYAPLAVLCLGFPRQAVAHALDGCGFLAPRGQGLRVLGALFCSTIFAHRAPAGHVLLRALIGGARDPAALALDDAELGARALADLDRALGLRDAPALLRIFRHPQAIPQYTLGHAARLARIDASLHRHRGLLITGNAYRGIGINACVRNAWWVAEELLALLDRRRDPRAARARA